MHENGHEGTSEIQVQKNLVKNGEILETKNYIMSDEKYKEFEQNKIEPYTVCDEGNACWETSAKKLFMETSKGNC